MGNQKSSQKPFVFHSKDDILFIKDNLFKVKDCLIRANKKAFKIIENQASLFFQYGDALKYSLFVYENEFEINQLKFKHLDVGQSIPNNIDETVPTQKYKYMMLTPFVPQDQISEYLKQKQIPESDFTKKAYFMMLFFNDLKEIQHKLIKGFQFQQNIKGNVILDLTTQKLVSNIQRLLAFDYSTHFEAYFQLNQKQMESINDINQKSSNFLFSLIATYLIQASLFTLHRIDTGSEIFIKKSEEIKRVIEYDFSSLQSGKNISNVYFWKKIKGITHQNLIFELQKHKLADKAVIGSISQFIRKINPYSPQNKKYRIVMYSLKEDNTQYSKDQQQRQTLTGDFNNQQVQQQQGQYQQNQDDNNKEKEQEYINLQELYNSNDLEELELKMYNIEKDDEVKMSLSSIYRTKAFQSVPVFNSDM